MKSSPPQKRRRRRRKFAQWQNIAPATVTLKSFQKYVFLHRLYFMTPGKAFLRLCDVHNVFLIMKSLQKPVNL
ncbi:hypothetical protein [Azospirillum palustre]